MTGVTISGGVIIIHQAGTYRVTFTSGGKLHCGLVNVEEGSELTLEKIASPSEAPSKGVSRGSEDPSKTLGSNTATATATATATTTTDSLSSD